LQNVSNAITTNNLTVLIIVGQGRLVIPFLNFLIENLNGKIGDAYILLRHSFMEKLQLSGK